MNTNEIVAWEELEVEDRRLVVRTSEWSLETDITNDSAGTKLSFEGIVRAGRRLDTHVEGYICPGKISYEGGERALGQVGLSEDTAKIEIALTEKAWAEVLRSHTLDRSLPAVIHLALDTTCEHLEQHPTSTAVILQIKFCWLSPAQARWREGDDRDSETT